LDEILELEEMLLQHSAKEHLLTNGTRLAFEKTKLGTIVDFDSSKATGKSHLEMNIEMIPIFLKELGVRDIGGIILLDVISLSSQAESKKLINRIETCVNDISEITFHGVTPLGIAEFTRKAQRQGIMGYTSSELLLERLFFRIKHLEVHAEFKELVIHLNDKYYLDRRFEKELKKTFDFVMSFIYNQNVEDFSIKLNNHID
jgi:hypothetical protein